MLQLSTVVFLSVDMMNIQFLSNMFFQVSPVRDLRIEVFLEQLNILLVPREDLVCSEYCFQVNFSPWQHAKFDKNIPHLAGVVAALSNTCGGIILLLIHNDETENIITEHHLHNAKMRLFELLHSWLDLPSDTILKVKPMPLPGHSGCWAALLVRKSSPPVVAKLCSSEAVFEVDISGHILERGNTTIAPAENLSVAGCCQDTIISDFDETTYSVTEKRNMETETDDLPLNFAGGNDDDDDDDDDDDSASDMLETSPDQLAMTEIRERLAQDLSDLPSTNEGDDDNDASAISQALLDDLGRCTSLNWTDNKKNWMSNLKISDSADINLKDFTLDVLNPSTPMRFTPGQDAIWHLFPNEVHMQEVLDKVSRQNSDSFGLVLKQVASILPLHIDVCQPTHHICDILTISKDGNVCIWMIVKEHATGSLMAKDQYTYMWTAGRMLKHQLYRYGCPSLSLQCILYSVAEKTCHAFPQKDFANRDGLRDWQAITAELSQECLSWLSPIEKEFDALQQALARMILSKESFLKRSIGKEIQMQLSAQQMAVILKTGKINYIQGPAGSGKTYCAFFLCERAGKDKSLYFCTTDAFLKFLQHQDNCVPALIKNDQDLCESIGNGLLSGKTCVIIDDSHNLNCSEKSLMELFEVLAKKENKNMCLYIFTDNVYQSYDTERRERVYHSLYSCCQKVFSQFEWVQQNLTEVHRNTRKIVAFIQETTADSVTSFASIVCANKEDGDNVECITMNAFNDEDNNELVQLIKAMKKDLFQLSANAYETRTIAVLLNVQADTQELLQRCKYILQKGLLSDIIQTAGEFPRKGIVLDSVENFMGQDADVCIWVACSGAECLEKAEYRAFLASRAIYRAVFVMPEFNQSIIQKMKFDQIKVSCLLKVNCNLCMKGSMLHSGAAHI